MYATLVAWVGALEGALEEDSEEALEELREGERDLEKIVDARVRMLQKKVNTASFISFVFRLYSDFLTTSTLIY